MKSLIKEPQPLQGNICYLRALEVDDIDLLYDWENDSTFWDCSLNFIPLSKQTIREYVFSNMENYLFTHNQIRFMICLKHNDETIGTIDLFDHQPIHLRASVGIFIHSLHQNQGYAKDALQCLSVYAKKHLQLHQLYAEINLQNTNSMKLFHYCGFQECGNKKEWLRFNDQWEDVICLQKIL